MSNENEKNGGGFGKPIGGAILVVASLTGLGGEPIEPKPNPLSALIAQPAKLQDLFVTHPTHGPESGTGYVHTVHSIVAMVTTSS